MDASPDTEFDFLANALRQRDEHHAIRATLSTATPIASETADLDSLTGTPDLRIDAYGIEYGYLGTDSEGFGHWAGVLL